MQQFVSELLLFSGFRGVCDFKGERKKPAGARENSSVVLLSAWVAWRERNTKNIPVIFF